MFTTIKMEIVRLDAALCAREEKISRQSAGATPWNRALEPTSPSHFVYTARCLSSHCDHSITTVGRYFRGSHDIRPTPHRSWLLRSSAVHTTLKVSRAHSAAVIAVPTTLKVSRARSVAVILREIEARRCVAVVWYPPITHSHDDHARRAKMPVTTRELLCYVTPPQIGEFCGTSTWHTPCINIVAYISQECVFSSNNIFSGCQSPRDACFANKQSRTEQIRCMIK